MKTSEFKKKIEEFGLKVTKRSDVFDIHDEYGTRYASINRLIGECVSFNTSRIYLIKLCLEYAETPISEREEERKYTVVLPDPERSIESNKIVLSKTRNDKIVINNAKEGNIERIGRYHLTEAEIKRNHEYLWQFAKEVEE